MTQAARVAMISGANRGIGAGIAERLRQDGWTLSLGVRDPARLTAPPYALVHAFDADMSQSEARWVEATISRFGRIDAVVNNAGLMIPKSVIEAEDDDLMAMFQVNVRSPMRLARAAWPHLAVSGRGRIVTIASLSGKRVKSAQSGTYSVTKFAAIALSHALRQAGWEAGIRTTAICPGFVASDMSRAITAVDQAAMTQPEEIARLVSMVLDLPNSASVSELAVNCLLDDSY